MILKVFLKDKSVRLYTCSDVTCDEFTLKVIFHDDAYIDIDTDRIKNYTVYSDTGMMVHTTYKRKKRHDVKPSPYNDPNDPEGLELPF